MSNKQGDAKDFVPQPWGDENNAPRMPCPEFHNSTWDHVILPRICCTQPVESLHPWNLPRPPTRGFLFTMGRVTRSTSKCRDQWIEMFPGFAWPTKAIGASCSSKTLGGTATTRCIYLTDNYIIVETARSKIEWHLVLMNRLLNPSPIRFLKRNKQLYRKCI